jgi:hypothetical protein
MAVKVKNTLAYFDSEWGQQKSFIVEVQVLTSSKIGF